jgi:hypothetical protein
MVIKTNKEAQDYLILLDTIKRRIKTDSDAADKIQTALQDFMGAEECKKLSAGEMFYKRVDAAGKINEDKLRADFPEIYKKYVIEKIDAKALSKGEPSAYNAVLISGAPQRRFTYNLFAEKIIAKTEKKIRRTLCPKEFE